MTYNYRYTTSKTRIDNVLRIVVLASVLICSYAVHADDMTNDPHYGEIWKKSQTLRDQLSADTTPIEFSVGDVRYKVPRNYLSSTPDSFRGPIFRVTFPKFEPLTEKSKQCLTQPMAYWPSDCVPVEFWAKDAAGLLLSDDDHFNNGQKGIPPQTPKRDQYGFDEYRYGPEAEPNRILYKKITAKHTLLIDCTRNDVRGWRNAVCTNYDSPLSNGNVLSYRLYVEQIKDAESIDNGIRDLIDSFTLKGEKP